MRLLSIANGYLSWFNRYQTANYRLFKSWRYCFNTPVAAGADIANSFTGSPASWRRSTTLKESKVTIAKKSMWQSRGR